MISLKSKSTLESKSTPGVSFTVRTLNKIQRAKRDLLIIETRQQMSALVREYGPLAELETPTPEQAKRKALIDVEYTWLEDRDLKPALLRAGIVSVEGMEIDGKAVTVDALIESAGADYDALIDEMYTACEAASGLSATETKNSSSDTTSTEQVVPASPDSTVTSAA